MQVKFHGFILMGSTWLCKGKHVWIRVTAGYCRQSAHNRYVSVSFPSAFSVAASWIHLPILIFKFPDVCHSFTAPELVLPTETPYVNIPQVNKLSCITIWHRQDSALVFMHVGFSKELCCAEIKLNNTIFQGAMARNLGMSTAT